MTSLSATVAFGLTGGARELRILGDQRRGYLLSGVGDLLDNDEGADFWFERLDEAIHAAAELGVERSRWTTIEVAPPEPAGP